LPTFTVVSSAESNYLRFRCGRDHLSLARPRALFYDSTGESE
jgi:hypothetical protein